LAKHPDKIREVPVEDAGIHQDIDIPADIDTVAG
jgi:CTP:molybdopterin cytidylyltransferase MocA